MVHCCIAAGCSNTPSDTITLFKFPNDCALRDKWVRQVRRTRAEWTATEHSVLCSEHFTEDCFEAEAALAQTFGLTKRKRLKVDAIPMIFHGLSAEQDALHKRHHNANTPTSAGSSIGKRARSAVEKEKEQR